MNRRVLLLVSLGLVAVLAWVVWRLRVPEPGAAHGGDVDTLGTGYKSVRLYFAAPNGEGLVSESRELPDRTDFHDRAAELVSELDRGPTGSGVAALPPGTSLLHVYLDDQGLMTADLSRAFQQGFRGGSTNEYLAVASLVRTFGDDLPEVKRVLIVCGGEPLPTLSHLPLDRPLDPAELP